MGNSFNRKFFFSFSFNRKLKFNLNFLHFNRLLFGFVESCVFQGEEFGFFLDFVVSERSPTNF